MPVLNDPYFQQYINARNIKPNSINRYTIILRQYTSFLNKTPTELIREAREDQTSIPWISDRRITNYFYTYYQTIQDKSYNTVKGNLTFIRAFYSHFEIDTPKLKIPSSNTPQLLDSDLPGVDDIRNVLRNVSHKYQSIILLMCSSGLSRADVLKLDIKDLETALNQPVHIGETHPLIDKNDHQLICTWQGNRIKNSIPYITFSSPETTRSILDYLTHHRDGTTKPEDPLFTSTHGTRLSIQAFMAQFKHINRKCHYPLIGSHHFFTSHQLRRFFSTVLTKHRVPYLFTEWMLGHRIPPVQGAYSKPSVEALKQEYIRVLPYLTIREKVTTRILTDERLEKLEKDNQELREWVEILRRKDQLPKP